MILKDYQKEAKKQCLLRNKLILNMGCRTGKTITSLKAIKYPSVVVIGPPNLKDFWLSESKKRNKPLATKYISRFAKKELFKTSKKKPKAVIVDESHQNISWTTSKSVLEMCKTAKQVIFLTATPLINNPLDFYWPLKICGGWSGSKADFTLLFCGGQRLRKNPQIVYPTGLTNRKELKKRIDACTHTYFRPENVIKKIKVIRDKPISPTTDIRDFATIQKMQGFMKCQDRHLLKYLKIKLDKFGKVGILYFHKDLGRDLKIHLDGKFLIDGNTPIKKRDRIIEEFENCNKGFIFLNYVSCGVGIDIQTVDCVVFAESTWSPAKDYQAYMRFYGFNRDKPLYVHYPVYYEEERFMVSQRKEKVLSFLTKRGVKDVCDKNFW